MYPIRCCLDDVPYTAKQDGDEIKKIHYRIGHKVHQINSLPELKEFIEKVCLRGHTFCPATFKDGTRCKVCFEQQQIIALDFDNKDPLKTVTYHDVLTRANNYDLEIVAIYETLSSVNGRKFRVLFINDSPITDCRVMEAIQWALYMIFPEADLKCIKDVSKMYFGGIGLLYFNESTPTVNVESIFRGLTFYYEERYKNHYKEKISKFSEEHGIALNDEDLFDVKMSDEPFESAHLTEEDTGAYMENNSGKISPNSIFIYIKANGENFPRYYRIGLSDCTRNSSIVNIDEGNIYDFSNSRMNTPSNGHKNYRSDTLLSMSSKCPLYRDFCSGKRKLSHGELFHLQLNMRNVDSGDSKFLSILQKYPKLYPDEKVKKWKRHCKYNKQQRYRPSGCSMSECPYRETCEHGRNILTTSHPKHRVIEEDLNYGKECFSLSEAEKSMYRAVSDAFRDDESSIIKAPCAIGKTTAILEYMRTHPDLRILYAAPTNTLKDQTYKNASDVGLDVCKTPSLDQIAHDLPTNVRIQIMQFYIGGKPQLVHPYLERFLQNNNIPCLREYMEERIKVQRSKGSLITTHRYLMNMDTKKLNGYDLVVIDEDFIYKTYITNQCNIPISELKRKMNSLNSSPFLSEQNKQLLEKIKALLEGYKLETYIKLNGFKWSNVASHDELFDDKFVNISLFDESAFAQAEHFYLRHAADDDRIKEDTVVFIKPFALKRAKYIMLSATTNETVCRQFFAPNRVAFHECKQAEYKGTLIQFPGRSMSRSSIANDNKIVERIMRKTGFTETNLITFANQGLGQMHFGNTDGMNLLEGEDLLVIGTPYHPEFLYKLVAHNLGFVFDENEKMSQQYINCNGYKTWFTTFKDENLRAIHLWMIESELEQAVGRARLSRNICKVLAFTNFPLKQAKMGVFDYGEKEASTAHSPEGLQAVDK